MISDGNILRFLYFLFFIFFLFVRLSIIFRLILKILHKKELFLKDLDFFWILYLILPAKNLAFFSWHSILNCLLLSCIWLFRSIFFFLLYSCFLFLHFEASPYCSFDIELWSRKKRNKEVCRRKGIRNCSLLSSVL